MKKTNKLSEKIGFIKAAWLISGVYLLLSIICQWWDEAEEHLHDAGALHFTFKQEFMNCKKSIERFEVSMRRYVNDDKKEELLKDYDLVQTKLRKYLFNDNV